MKKHTKKHILEKIDEIINDKRNKLSKEGLIKLIKIREEIENDSESDSNGALKKIVEIVKLLFGKGD